MHYKYTAYSQKGTMLTDLIVAKNKEAAQAALESRGWTVETLKISWGTVVRSFFGASIGGVTIKDKMFFTRNLAVMVKSGLSLDDALSILSEQASNSSLASVLVKVNEAIRGGKTLSEAMEKFSKVFTPLYVNIIAAAEKGGTLEESLAQLAVQIEKSYDLRIKIRNALYYPVLVIVATMVVGILLSILVLPKVTALFVSFNTELPFTTKALIGFSEFITTQTIWAIVILIGIIGVILIFTRAKIFRPVWHRMIITLPIVGRIARYFNIALFSRTLSTLLSSGVPINQALDVAGRTLSNVHYRAIIQELVKSQQMGESLGALLKEYPKQFPPIVYRMIAIGEESGNLEDTLSFLAEFYEREIDVITKNLSTILEPLLLIFIGIAVGTVALAIITPIYKITGSFGFQ